MSDKGCRPGCKPGGACKWVGCANAGREPYEHLACCGIHWTQRPGGHCDWTCCEHDGEEVVR